jgi:hypothetical protein
MRCDLHVHTIHSGMCTTSSAGNKGGMLILDPEATAKIEIGKETKP